MMLHCLFLPLDLRKLDERKQEMSEKIHSYHVLRAKILKKMRDRDPLFKVPAADKQSIFYRMVQVKEYSLGKGDMEGRIFLVRFPWIFGGFPWIFSGFPWVFMDLHGFHGSSRIFHSFYKHQRNSHSTSVC